MAKRNLHGKRVLITGCSSGIGRELTLKLAERGAVVLATARREDRLEMLGKRLLKSASEGEWAKSAKSQLDVHHDNFHYLAGDICDPAFRQQLVEWVRSNWGSLDILINNAGVGGIGYFEEAAEDKLRSIMEVDFFAAVELTRHCIPLLRLGNRPAILNIGSVLSHRATPLKSEYCAAKFALRGWAESLRIELIPHGIDVLMLSPSTTRSEFFDSLVDTDPRQRSASVGSMSPSKVADAAITVLVRSKRDLVLSLGGKFLVWAGKLVPTLTDRLLFKFGMPTKPS